MRSWADVAELTKAKSLEGGLVARCAPGLPFLLREGMEVAFVPPVLDAPRRARVRSVQARGEDAAVVAFDAVGDIRTAEMLVGCHILVRRADLPAGALEAAVGEWDGWEVHDARAGRLGTVAGIRLLPGQELLEVEADAAGARTILIPLVDEFVAGVDPDARRIDVDVPDGLLDL